MNVREDFPILQRKINGKPLVYFDNAATTQKPKQVLDAVTEFYENQCGNVGRGVHTLSRETSEIYEAARKSVAKFIGANPEEIIFTSNATHSLNMVALSQESKLGSCDEIVTTVMEHHSNYVPLMMLAKNCKCGVSLVDMGQDGKLKMDDYRHKVRPSTCLVSATHVSNVLGTVNPVEEMAKIAHENDALFVLDAAQSVPHMPINVKKLDCDFMAFSGHKMLAPMGIGVLYGKSDILEELEPMLVGGGTISHSCPGEVRFLKPPQKFEAGTPNVGGAVGLKTAIEYLDKLGMDKVEKHEKDLAKYTLDNLDAEIYAAKDGIGIIPFNLPGVNADDVATVLDESGAAVRSGQHCAQPLMCRLHVEGTVRMSYYIYNTKEEVDYALDIIEKIKSLA